MFDHASNGASGTARLNMSMNVQSVVTTPVTKPNGKVRAKVNDTTSLTPAQAIEIAFEYGQTMAGQDGALTNAFTTFKTNDKVIGDMIQALTEGYMVRKLGYDRAKAKLVISLKKYNQLNPTKNTDENRTQEQERIMTAVRVLVSRAKRMAGITEAPVTKPATKPATKPSSAHPDGSDPDVNVTMVRFLQTIQAYYKKHAAEFVDDAGMAWRDWIAQAPKVILAK